VRRQQLEGEENALNEVRLWLLAHPPAAIVALRCRVLRRESSSGPPALRERYGADATWLREQLDPQERHGLAAAHARLLSKVRQMDKRKHLFTREAWEAECDRLQAIADEFDRVKLGPLRRKLEACQSLVMAIDRAAELIEAACCDPSAEALLKKTLVEIERKEAVYAAVRIELSEAMPAAGAGRSARASHPSDAEELLPLS
jgi:hypothetical protein